MYTCMGLHLRGILVHSLVIAQSEAIESVQGHVLGNKPTCLRQVSNVSRDVLPRLPSHGIPCLCNLAAEKDQLDLPFQFSGLLT